MRNAIIAVASALFLAAGGSLAQEAALNDAQISAIAEAANKVDIDAGKMARSRASNPEVKRFAEQMVTDHTSANKSAHDLLRKLKMKPEENESSKSLKAGGEENMKKLKGMKGAEFDSAYMDQEVTFHQTVLDTLDKSLIPNAKNSELKTLLNQNRSVVADHLEHAKRIQSSLGKKGS